MSNTGDEMPVRNRRDFRRTSTQGFGKSVVCAFALAVLALAPLAARSQAALVPELFADQLPIPQDQAFGAQAYFFGTPVDFNNHISNIDIVGDQITARFDPGCAPTCPAAAYSPHNLDLPALLQGTYNLKIVAASNSSSVLAQYPLVVGSQTLPPTPAPQMFTIPAQVVSGRPSSLYAFFASSVTSWRYDDVSVSGNVITAPVEEGGCGFATCPPGRLLYGPAIIGLPALPAGSYTLHVVDSRTATLYAQFTFVVAAGTAITAAPALHPLMLWCLIALFVLAALPILRTARRPTKDFANKDV